MTVIYRVANGYIVRNEWGSISPSELPTVHVFESLSGVATFLKDEEFSGHPDCMAANHKSKRRKK